MHNIRERIKKATIFSNLLEDDLEYLLSISTIKKAQKDSIIFYKGETPSSLYVLLEGKCKVYKHNQKGADVVMKTFEDVSLIAEIANLEKMPYPSNCMAQSDSILLCIDYAKFEHYFLKNTELLLLFVKSLTNKVFTLEQMIHSNITLDASSRVAKYIYENEEAFFSKSNIEIAELLNITPETLSRVIKKFKNAELLLPARGKYKINEEKKDLFRGLFED